jgi:hypothetical protein
MIFCFIFCLTVLPEESTTYFLDYLLKTSIPGYSVSMHRYSPDSSSEDEAEVTRVSAHPTYVICISLQVGCAMSMWSLIFVSISYSIVVAVEVLLRTVAVVQTM